VKRILVAWEYSGTVREAFKRRGWDSFSCDLLPTEVPGQHYQCDVLKLSPDGWDLVIAHPPCTYLTVSGNGAFRGPDGYTKNGTKRDPWRYVEVEEALSFVTSIWGHFHCPMAIENPVGRLSSIWRKPDQTIQPWEYGHGEVKRTCLWLRELPLLQPSDFVTGREAKCHRMTPGPDRWKERSRTLSGIAAAMADQWGRIV